MPPDARPEVWLARHGETAWNAEGRIQGHLDVPLSPRGVEQAARLARRLAQTPPARIVSSDLARARATAEAVAGALGLALTLDPALREQHLGAWQGLTGAEASLRDPDLYGVRFVSRDPSARPPGGETRAELQERVCAALERHAAAGSGGPLLVVTHGGVISALLYRALGLPLARPRPFALPNVGLTTLAWDAGGWRPRTIGDVAHDAGARPAGTFPFD